MRSSWDMCVILPLYGFSQTNSSSSSRICSKMVKELGTTSSYLSEYNSLNYLLSQLPYTYLGQGTISSRIQVANCWLYSSEIFLMICRPFRRWFKLSFLSCLRRSIQGTPLTNIPVSFLTGSIDMLRM